MNHTQLIKFLEKFEAYLKDIHPIITPENWAHYKEHGSLPAMDKEDELQAKLLKAGWNKDLILEDITGGKISKQDAYELFDNIFTPEELNELVDALADDDMVEIADALTDILYVTYGAGVAFGIELDSCFDEVHRSNMSKLGPDGKPIYREDGKVLKGADYSEPNLAPFILKGH